MKISPWYEANFSRIKYNFGKKKAIKRKPRMSSRDRVISPIDNLNRQQSNNSNETKHVFEY